MAARKPAHKCYELQGDSLAAVQTYVGELAQAIRQEKQRAGGPQWQGFYQRTFAALSASHPGLFEQLGLSSPSTVIKGGAGEFPRAYLEYPRIYASHHQPARYYMYVPGDHTDNAFVPQDARALGDDEQSGVDAMLFAGGWADTPPLLALPRRGVALPDDIAARPVSLSFVKAASPHLPAETDFIAAGHALALVRQHESALADYQARVEQAFNALRKAAETLFPEMLKDYPAGEGLYVNLGAAGEVITGADTCLTLSIRRDGKGGDFMAGGKPMAIADNPYFKVAPYRGGDYAVITRDDTPQGRQLAKVLLAVPAKRPSLSDHPALVIDGVTPVLVQQGQYKVLRYFIKDADKALQPPQGALPFPPAALAWLRADEEDRQLGCVPPPMPQQLAAYLALPLKHAGDSTVPVARGAKKPAK